MSEKYKWFIIRCPSGSEENFINELKTNLIKLKSENILTDHFIPNLEKPKGKATMVSYVFIKAMQSETLDIVIQRIPFASYLLDGSSNPATSTQDEVEKMTKNQENMEKQAEEANKIEPGQTILIKEGPFKDFSGVIESFDENSGLITASVSVFDKPLLVKDLSLSSFNVITKEGKMVDHTKNNGK